MERDGTGKFVSGHTAWNRGTGWKNGVRICKCGKEFNPRKKYQKSCSQHCAMIGSKRRLGIKMTENTKNKIQKTFFKKGHIPWDKGTKGVVKGYWEGKHRVNMMMEKHPQWKGGVTPINEKIRKSLEYKLWRKSVFERDNYTCVWCKKHGGHLHADHIKSFSLFPELRFAIDNGRTLCVRCHKLTETYGNGKK